MNTKTIFSSVLVHLILAFLSGIAFDAFVLKSDDSFLRGQIKSIQDDRDSLQVKLNSEIEKREIWRESESAKLKTIDSLESYIRFIERSIKFKDREVDSLIVLDSLNAIIQYRKALEQLGIIPDVSKNLSLKEIGYGAKFLFQNIGLKLKINFLDSSYTELKNLIILKNKILKSLEISYKLSQEDIKKSEKQTLSYKIAYEDATSFWNNRINLTIGGTIIYVDSKMYLGVGATFGFRIWGN